MQLVPSYSIWKRSFVSQLFHRFEMDVLRLFDVCDVTELMELLIVYNSLPEAVEGIKWLIARRLLTVAFEESGFEEAQRYLADIRSRAILLPVLQEHLERVLARVPASNSFSQLSINQDDFQRLLDREITRLQDPLLYIQNTVKK